MTEIPDAATISKWIKDSVHSNYPWEVQQQPEHSEIEAFIAATGEWEIIATIKCENHFEVASLIVTLVNRWTQQPQAANEP
jgi:hypothetical protein